MSEDPDELLTLNDAAPLLGLKNGNNVRSYIRRGLLKAEKFGPIWTTTRADINAYLAMKKGSGKHYSTTRQRKRYIDPTKVILPS